MLVWLETIQFLSINEPRAKQEKFHKKEFETLLSFEVNNEQMRDLLIRLDYDPTSEMALALVILQKALNGDVKAFAKIQDVIDSK